MEIHAHSHSASGGSKKKWTHYLWEFLMLFLAVFCGFLAENQREHMVEHKKEIEFMGSLIEDLQEDTLRLRLPIKRLEYVINSCDSLMILYSQKDRDQNFEKYMAFYGIIAGSTIDVVFSDRTSSQLKGSGGMRMVRKKEVADSILKYWNNQVRIERLNDKYDIVQIEHRKIGNKTFTWWPFFKNNTWVGSSKDQVLANPVKIKNEELLDEFVNTSSNLYSRGSNQLLPQLKRELSLATNLISLIREKYHLD